MKISKTGMSMLGKIDIVMALLALACMLVCMATYRPTWTEGVLVERAGKVVLPNGTASYR